MGRSGVEKKHGWTFTTIVAEADGSVVLRVTPTRDGAMSELRDREPTSA